MNAITFIAACALLTASAASFAQEVQRPAVAAEVRKVDLDAKKITLNHGDIPNIDMMAMTMVFRVKDDALLTKVKAGDKVTFTADRIDGAITVMTIEVESP